MGDSGIDAEANFIHEFGLTPHELTLRKVTRADPPLVESTPPDDLRVNESFLPRQPERAARRSSAARSNGSRSFPKYMSSRSRYSVGDPKPPRSMSSSVLALSLSLMSCCAMPVKKHSRSTPSWQQIAASTSSLEMS